LAAANVENRRRIRRRSRGSHTEARYVGWHEQSPLAHEIELHPPDTPITLDVIDV
jgi:hypothetical protein